MKPLGRKRLRTIASFTAWGGVIGAGLGLFIGWLDQVPLFNAAARGMAVGVPIGSLVGTGEELLLPRWSRSVGFGFLTFSRIMAYTVAICAALVLVNGLARSVAFGAGLFESVYYYAVEGGLRRDLVLAFFAGALTASFLQVRKLHNPGEIWRLLAGRYHYPEKETRVFLFADLADSTGNAERLGDLEFSRFLRSCFSDVSEAILAWRGRVYQHAGDAVIVSWPMADGCKDGACLQCFFDMVGLLEAREEFYLARYGTAPRLRAGIHGGTVVTTWVGEARKDLAFHGDTMNTTARLESMCKELGAQCLTSEVIHDAVAMPSSLMARPVGEVELRGRATPVRVFSVESLRESHR